MITLSNILVVALKEYSESIHSIRFKLLFLIFLSLILISAYEGARQYQLSLKAYNQAVGSTQSYGDVEVKLELPKPSVLTAFTVLMSSGVAVVGAILGIFLGFNAISGEREQGSLDFLLTQPLFRDDILNGKMLGFILLIFTVVFASGLFSFGVISTLTGVFPSGDEFWRILTFFTTLFIYILSFASISVLFSVLFKSSVDALLASISVFVILNMLLSPLGDAAASLIYPLPIESFAENSAVKFNAIFEKQLDMKKTIDFFSPSGNFEQTSSVILDPYLSTDTSQEYSMSIRHSLSESLGLIWSNIVALILTLALPFIASYILFLRQDI